MHKLISQSKTLCIFVELIE